MRARKVTVAFQEVEPAASRVFGQLRRLADEGLARRHPSGADYWQRLPAPPA